MPELKCERLNKVLCRTCGNLNYWDGYYCDCENLPEEFENEHFEHSNMGTLFWINYDIEMTECPGYIKRIPCEYAPQNFDCQFWCSGNHHDSPMEPCLYAKKFLNEK